VALRFEDGTENGNHAQKHNTEQQGIYDQEQPPQTQRIGASLSPTMGSMFSMIYEARRNAGKEKEDSCVIATTIFGVLELQSQYRSWTKKKAE
jgi:hypothetical protein